MALAKETTSTWGISSRVRRKVRAFVLAMRTILEEDLSRQLASLGITPEATTDPPKALDPYEERLREAAVAVIERAVSGSSPHIEAFELFVRESAFTFLNRLVGLRALEERGMLLVEGRSETAIRKDPELRVSSLYFRVQGELPEASAPREVWRETLGRAFRGVSERIGLLFDPDSEFGRYLPLPPALTKAIDGLNAPDIPPETYAEVELLGWVYQYYNAEEKDAVYAKLGKGGKLERPEEIAAATCLYTERYMVDFLLQNTLGALWVRMRPGTKLPEAWPYYVAPPEGQPEPEDEELPERVRDITLLDPAAGSGHFLMRAFDLLAQMYEEEGIEDPVEVPALILERNLHGIDIDPRAIQISALGLYLKGCALAGPQFRPRRLNLVSAYVSLPGAAPPSLLERYATEPDIQELMKTLWSELKDAPKLGSLLHPERKVDELLTKRIKTGDTLLHQGGTPEEVKLEILEGLRQEFDKEAHSDDIAQRLFGTNLERSLSLVEALSRRYDVVVMNPPYAGRKNLDEVVRRHVDFDYRDGKADLYAAFILRCVEFVRDSGWVAMVTRQSWMFLKSFLGLREVLLSRTSLLLLGHIGARGFEEVGGEVVSAVMFALRNRPPVVGHRLKAFRLTSPPSAVAKALLLRDSIVREGVTVSTPPQQYFQAAPHSSILYWLSDRLLALLSDPPHVSDCAALVEPSTTGDSDRFFRAFWEVSGIPHGWLPASRGGQYCKWYGARSWLLDWRNDGAAIKSYPASYIRNEWAMGKPGLTYSEAASGSLGLRQMEARETFAKSGPGLVAPNEVALQLMGLLNARSASYLARGLSRGYLISLGAVGHLPGTKPGELASRIEAIAAGCVRLKRILASSDVVDRSFRLLAGERVNDSPVRDTKHEETAEALHALEGVNEHLAMLFHALNPEEVRVVLLETGTPAGWHPLIRGYDHHLTSSGSADLPDELGVFLNTLERLDLSADAIASLKTRLRALYESGPGAKAAAAEKRTEEGEEPLLGAGIPIPTETFLEELSQTLGIHPISVYNLLEEMREEEGLVSPPLMKDAVEDYVSVSLLRILGYRWPEQDAYENEHGPIIPSELVDPDGIVALVKCNDEPTAIERIRARMEHQFGEDGAQSSEKEFRTWAGKDLELWLEKDFFKRHISQFKKRPIAWHLSSEEGTFQTFVLYHRLSRETLQRIRSLYAGGLIRRLQAEEDRARGRGDDAAARKLAGQIEDVEEFAERLKAIEEGSELEARLRCRWKGEEQEGRPGPYAPDIDDGVKVNIRPFQEMGLLAKQVISKW